MKQISVASIFSIAIFLMIFCNLSAYAGSDSLDIEKIRTESGVDPTRVNSKASFSTLIYDKSGNSGSVVNRASLNIGVERWSITLKVESVSNLSPGNGFSTDMGDIKFSILNAFYVSDKNALAGAVEFSLPTGKPDFGTQYLSATPSITYSYTISPVLFVAVQPQFTFDMMKDEQYPELSVLTVRSFFARFTDAGYFFVLEGRPVYDFTSENFDFIISPIIGKAVGGGYNLLFLSEIPTKSATIKSRGITYQFGFNKNF